MPELMRIEVEPQAASDEIIPGEPLLVRVSEPPSGGAANKAVVRLLSRYFGKRVIIVSGGKRRKKIISVG